MEKPRAIAVMSALSQPVRLDVFLLLAGARPEGMTSGDLAIATASAPSTMSAHLAILSRAGLVTSEKAGRNAVYRAIVEPVGGLASFLTDACRSQRANGGSRR